MKNIFKLVFGIILFVLGSLISFYTNHSSEWSLIFMVLGGIMVGSYFERKSNATK